MSDRRQSMAHPNKRPSSDENAGSHMHVEAEDARSRRLPGEDKTGYRERINGRIPRGDGQSGKY